MPVTKSLALALCALVGLLATACTSHTASTDLPPGKYKSTSRSVNAAGTEIESSKTTDVTVDEYGNKRVVTETEQSKDPEGLFNKSTSTSKTVEKSGY